MRIGIIFSHIIPLVLMHLGLFSVTYCNQRYRVLVAQGEHVLLKAMTYLHFMAIERKINDPSFLSWVLVNRTHF